MTFAWVPPLGTEAEHPNDLLAGPETIDLDEIDAAFDELEKEIATQKAADNDVDGAEVLEGSVYSFEELDRIDGGLAPRAFEDDVNIMRESKDDRTWDVDDLMSSEGVSSF